MIVTFYGDLDEAPPLHERLYRRLAGKPQATGIPDFWQDGEASLRLFHPPAARDTAVVQVLLNGSGDADEAWGTMRRQLQDILDGTDLPERWWGYTLVHHAVLKQGIGADQALIGLRSSVQKLGPSESPFPLEQTDVPGGKGKVWLLDTPLQSDGLAAATVYLTLGPSEDETPFARMFYGPDAKLLMPDLIAHKGYHQMRQHRGGDLESMHATGVGSLRETTEQLLVDLGKGAVRAEKLDKLARKYHPLVSLASNLNDLHVSLVRQSYNYDRWRARIGGNNIIEYHREQLRTATLELKLKVEEIQAALETADKAVSVAQVQVDKAQEEAQREAEERRQEEEKEENRHQQLIQTLLLVVATALALPEVIDRDVAGLIMIYLIPSLERFEGNTFAEFVAQSVITILPILAILIWLGVRRWRDKRREGHVSEGE